MSGNFAIKGGGGAGRLMANAILNFHFDFPHTSLTNNALTPLKALVAKLSPARTFLPPTQYNCSPQQ